MKLTMDDIMLMNALTTVSGVSPKDCLNNDGIVSFLVKDKEMGKAIGRQAVNIKELEQKLKKKVELVAFFEKPEEVIASTFDVKVTGAKTNGNNVFVTLEGAGKRKVLSNMGRLKRIQELIRRSYGKEISIQ